MNGMNLQFLILDLRLFSKLWPALAFEPRMDTDKHGWGKDLLKVHPIVRTEPREITAKEFQFFGGPPSVSIRVHPWFSPFFNPAR